MTLGVGSANLTKFKVPVTVKLLQVWPIIFHSSQLFKVQTDFSKLGLCWEPMGAAGPCWDKVWPMSLGWKESWQRRARSHCVRAGPGCSCTDGQPGQCTPVWFGKIACSSMGMGWRRGAALTEIHEGALQTELSTLNMALWSLSSQKDIVVAGNRAAPHYEHFGLLWQSKATEPRLSCTLLRALSQELSLGSVISFTSLAI